MEVVMRGEAIEFGETGDDGSAPIVSDTRIANRTAGETDPKLLSPLQILRSRLHSIFIKACHKVGIKTHIGKKLATIEQGEGSVTATFVDGTTATGDLLIGADGMHSATRRRVFGENLTATFTGSMEHQINLKETEECAFYVDRDPSEDIAAVQVSTFGDKEEQDKSASYRPYTDLPKHAGRLADLLHEWGVAPHVEKMMRCAFRVSAASIYDLPDMETYHKGRVLLVGDAAHGMVPNAGIGLLTGLEDVGTLLALFKRYPQGQDWDKVLALYSKIRVPRGTGAANQARNIRTKTVATTPIFGGNLNHFVFRLVIHAANAGMFSLYSLFDCEVEVAKAIEDAK
ncbi:FAD/NAD(P)-binding domain-containing protein [Rhizoclosmatium globosum]|uniref:FAD/NAD(P)-binding domain-containing protein n=1 Tax=Rhizoclosmatium globosum TaxID=329046 RepID=A0A1Y2BVX2_9FUNG|nr:FAD/NAD(P)-binding domain-containing protein [Rhizoclosmatium globosum]|eukprot:ORY38245.1 FAD/NAD(P)-binding domain-containing protein [Rhizoclosmatium globosum]